MIQATTPARATSLRKWAPESIRVAMHPSMSRRATGQSRGRQAMSAKAPAAATAAWLEGRPRFRPSRKPEKSPR